MRWQSADLAVKQLTCCRGVQGKQADVRRVAEVHFKVGLALQFLQNPAKALHHTQVGMHSHDVMVLNVLQPQKLPHAIEQLYVQCPYRGGPERVRQVGEACSCPRFSSFKLLLP